MNVSADQSTTGSALIGANGILPERVIQAMFAAQEISAAQPPVKGQIQPASLDLRLGPVAYRVRASFLPGPEHQSGEPFGAVETAYHRSPGRRCSGDGVRLHCSLAGEFGALRPDISATANPKSSTGRLDVFTRVITDNGQAFDTIPAGYTGPLYAEISATYLPNPWCAPAPASARSGSGGDNR